MEIPSDLNFNFDEIDLDQLLNEPASNGYPVDDNEDELLKQITEELFPPIPLDDTDNRLVDVTEVLNEAQQLVSDADLESIFGSIDSDHQSNGSTSDVCHVCGKECPKHNYYGGQVCNSCRAFFHRAVQGGKFSDFVCKLQNVCQINSKSWKSCQKCRYQKCISVGMRHKYVLSTKQRMERKQKKPSVKQFAVMNQTALVRKPADHFTLDESIFMEGIYKKGMDMCTQLTTDFYAENPESFVESIKLYNAGKKDTNQKAHNILVKGLIKESINFYCQLSDVCELPQNDKEKLLRGNFLIYTELATASSTTNKINANEFMHNTVRELSERAKTDSKVAELEAQFAELNVTTERDYSEGIDYDLIHQDVWAEDQESEKRHKYLYDKMSQWSMQDTTQMMIMFFSMIFSVDYVKLSSAKSVAIAQGLQTKYNYMLFRYLKDKYPNEVAAQKYRQSVYLGAMAKEAFELKKNSAEAKRQEEAGFSLHDILDY